MSNDTITFLVGAVNHHLLLPKEKIKKGVCQFKYDEVPSWGTSVPSDCIYPLNDIFNCQAQVQSPKVKPKGTWADTKIPWATTTTPPPPYNF